MGARGTSECEEQKGIDARLSKANRYAGAMNHLLGSNQLSRSATFKISKSIFRLTALYRCKNQVLNKNIQITLRT